MRLLVLFKRKTKPLLFLSRTSCIVKTEFSSDLRLWLVNLRNSESFDADRKSVMAGYLSVNFV